MLSVTDPDSPVKPPSSRAIRHLFYLGIALVLGFACCEFFRFTVAALNYVFGASVLCIPFAALRPVSRLSRIPKVIGFVLISPVLLLSLLMMLFSVSCDFDLHPYTGNSCLQDLETIEEGACSVHLILDGCGGATQSYMLEVEQRRMLVRGLYAFRSIEMFDSAYEGTMTSLGPNQIRVQIPKGVDGSGWYRDVDKTYTLRPHLYF